MKQKEISKRVCEKRVSTSGWMQSFPLTEKQEAERREYTEMMRKRYIAAGIKV